VTRTGATTPLVPYGYAGAYTDGGEHGTGHLWLGARQYDPGATVFTTKDPTSLLNRYAYGAGNPVTNVDPSGFSASGIGWQTWFSIGLAAVGVATAPFGGGVVFGVVSLVGAVGGLLLALEESEVTSYIPDEAEEPLAWAAVAVGAVGGIGALATKAGAISRLRWHMSTPGIPRDVVDDTWKIMWDDAALRAKYSSPARLRTAYRSNTKEGGEIHHLAIRGGQGEKQHLSRTEVPVTREGPIDIRPGFKDVQYDPNDLYHRTIERSMRQTAELGADQTRIGLAASNGAPTDEAFMESLVDVRDGMSFWQDIGTSASRRMNLRDNPGYWKQTILNEGGAQVANDHMYYPRNGFWGYMKANRGDA
jgi:RHS repeat-associated protein